MRIRNFLYLRSISMKSVKKKNLGNKYSNTTILPDSKMQIKKIKDSKCILMFLCLNANSKMTFSVYDTYAIFI